MQHDHPNTWSRGAGLKCLVSLCAFAGTGKIQLYRWICCILPKVHSFILCFADKGLIIGVIVESAKFYSVFAEYARFTLCFLATAQLCYLLSAKTERDWNLWISVGIWISFENIGYLLVNGWCKKNVKNLTLQISCACVPVPLKGFKNLQSEARNLRSSYPR